MAGGKCKKQILPSGVQQQQVINCKKSLFLWQMVMHCIRIANRLWYVRRPFILRQHGIPFTIKVQLLCVLPIPTAIYHFLDGNALFRPVVKPQSVKIPIFFHFYSDISVRCYRRLHVIAYPPSHSAFFLPLLLNFLRMNFLVFLIPPNQ